LHDVGCAIVGLVKYGYNHWDEHYMEDYGMNTLKAAGNAAVHGSTFGIIDHIW